MTASLFGLKTNEYRPMNHRLFHQMRTQTFLRRYFILGSIVAMCIIGTTLLQAKTKPTWVLKKDDDKVKIYIREKHGSDINELLGKTTLPVPPWVLMNVITDFGNYKDFMPFTTRSKIVKTKGKTVYSYQFLDVPILSNRDYVIAVTDVSYKDKKGDIVYKTQWMPSNELAPSLPSDTIRININEGYWTLQGRQNGKATLVNYYLYTSPGGSVPTWAANKGNTDALPDMFEAIEKQSHLQKYWKHHPPTPQ
jgi:hypothetical protein